MLLPEVSPPGPLGPGGSLPGASIPGALVESALLLLVVWPLPGSPTSRVCSSVSPTLWRP